MTKDYEAIHNKLNDQAGMKRRSNEKKRLIKRSDQIVKSNRYRAGKLVVKPIKGMQALFPKLKQELQNEKRENAFLVEQNRRLQEKLEAAEKKAAFLTRSIEDERAKDSRALVKEMENHDPSLRTIMIKLNEIQERKEADTEFLQAVADRYVHHQDADVKQMIFEQLYKSFDLRTLSEKYSRIILETSSNSCPWPASFNASLAFQTAKRLMEDDSAENALDDRLTAYRLADELNIVRPGISEVYTSAAAVPLTSASVVKPVDAAGSRGVYRVFSANQIQRIRDGQFLNSENEWREAMTEDLLSGDVHEDKWYLEEHIVEENGEPARDLKFYCFYGEVKLILEVNRSERTEFCWWDVNGKKVITGKYEDERFAGRGFSAEDLLTAEGLSKEIPAPFMRIDFLKTKNKLVLGEFTPKPGNYHEMNSETDYWLGLAYLEAEAKLTEDFLSGKTFKAFHAAVNESK
ncbi:ATP-grasp fold amidoligase family protein [Salisediminibacterium halotolerans]|uniref:ATP-grasp fold amidoligase family protein n=1 Tax=Salisediminibacterium halotolerans TaxID=517425 RepID=UPI000EB04973|nr:ATP-grasp fold amidoligase family protein [Salisediminibacterium halotolerans]RLJ75600.1 teichuronopeptide biosynthesis TupA-like protein [Actinophytocola xinjiangensis]RPE89454.1 teichuronopeptide biosynthesis TupA-like protein [Salisediminibacterium halotolerans]TWG36213.1 teichuronopeptide biosynthesis TupA-like protein [Salisediminibacterium halotolerans]GEL08352.1 hypothetical protein SHA02_17680 [Salisediminibacterium halotolerans]